MTNRTLKLKLTLAAAAFGLGISAQGISGLSGISSGLNGPFWNSASAHEAAKDMVKIPTLKNNIKVGELIGSNDIVYIKMPAAQVTNNIITNPQNLIGMAASWSLQAERPIREADVRHPILTKRGSLITMIVTLPNIRLTATGRALQNGALGDTIRLANTTTSKTVEGVVLADGSVAVGGATRTTSLSN